MVSLIQRIRSVIEDADRAELRPNGERKNGYIFSRARKEKQIQQMQQETEKLSSRHGRSSLAVRANGNKLTG